MGETGVQVGVGVEGAVGGPQPTAGTCLQAAGLTTATTMVQPITR